MRHLPASRWPVFLITPATLLRWHRELGARADRWLRTVRVECLDWTLTWSRQHLHRVLTRYVEHYNTGRPHRSLDLDVPVPAPLRR